MRILEELYYGGVSLREIAKQPSALHEKLQELLATNDWQMLAVLADEQKEQFEKCREAAELSDLMEREAFANGFCLTVKIMVEVMNTMETPDIDE